MEVTPDYAHAKVYFSLLVGDPDATQEALNQGAGFLRNGLFKRLHIHTVPDLALHLRPHDRARCRHERLDCQGCGVARP